MHKMTVNGKEITTNYKERVSYPITDGNGNYQDSVRFGETEESALNRLVDKGYTRITFYEMTTSVRGYHHVLIKCR